MTSLRAAGTLWALFGAYWVLMSFGRSPTRRRQSLAGRLAHLIYSGPAFILLYSQHRGFGPLQGRFVPHAAWIAGLGLLLTTAGLSFAVWARRHIGKQWSAEVAIREDHQLVATGPYARIRHPIYTGVLVAMLGTAIVIGEYRGLLAVLLVALGFWMKGRKEEAFLQEEFGAEYREHRRRTGFFLPRFG